MPTEMDLFARLAMAWHTPMGEEHEHPTVLPAKKAGFASYVGMSKDAREAYGDEDSESHDQFDEDAYDKTTPEPTKEDEDHYEEHGDWPEDYHDRHDQAYTDHMDAKQAENEPDSENDHLHNFIGNHGTNTSLWQNKAKLGNVPLTGPVHATQSHVSQTHIDKYLDDPHAEAHRPGAGGRYLANETPMFVTDGGKLHVTDGHHRVAAALQSGAKSIHAWHYDGDKHGLPSADPDMDDYDH